MYTHTSGVDHEQGSHSLSRLGGSGALPREKIDIRDGWRTILSLFYGRKFVFFQEIFIRNVHVSFLTLRTCVVCVMGVTPLSTYRFRCLVPPLISEKRNSVLEYKRPIHRLLYHLTLQMHVVGVFYSLYLGALSYDSRNPMTISRCSLLKVFLP